MSRTVLITGCGGYVGNVLARQALDMGYKVIGVDNFHKGNCDALFSVMDNDNFDFQYGDVTDLKRMMKLCERADAIIHLAAIVGFPACARQPALATAVNVQGTENMLLARTGKPMVFASTGSVYGKVEDVCTEDSPLNAVSLYGTTKAEAEQMVTACEKTVAFRFATGFGISPCMRVNLLVNDLVYRAMTERHINIFQADFRRTFVHVRDMANAFLWGVESIFNNTLKHKVYNCGANDLNWTKRELAEYIKEKTGCYVTYADAGNDADQRDYEVDYSRLNDNGFYCQETMEHGIDELLKVTPVLQIRHQYE
jgi:nucleoside-diphosphate-sugar epimerase